MKLRNKKIISKKMKEISAVIKLNGNKRGVKSLIYKRGLMFKITGL